VGEVTSALPLVRGIRAAFPQARIVFSATTRSGSQVAQRLLAPLVDALLPGPIDLGPVVPYFIRLIKPDLFILVETDFWPHWLHCLAQKKIPLLLVNGRISEKSFVQYRRFAFLCRPMFRSFTTLSMQTASDAEKMVSLGIEAEKVVALGNLKFDTPQDSGEMSESAIWAAKEAYGFDPTAPLWICGSTHRGEEQQIFQTFVELRRAVPDLQLLIAPRNIERGNKIIALGAQYNLTCRPRAGAKDLRGAILILDTIGELAACYPMAEAVFIGGSLVAEGGHNPIEPAVAGVPILFGPHMEDFAEIAANLVQCGGARQVESERSLSAALQPLFTNPSLRRAMTQAALACIQANQGVVRRHLEAIAVLLSRKTTER
jgi:3-deoxy-D-manno-octulosonic-acid transferase